MKQDVHFANVDLDIESNDELQSLIDCFGDDTYVLHHDRLENGNNFVALEIHLNVIEAGVYGEPEKTISAFCLLIENLPLETKKIWNNCIEKTFNIGFESGNTEKRFNTKIKPETVKRIAEIGASIVITIYPISGNTFESKENL